MMYFFYQTEEKGKWFPALASERDNLIKTKKPALVSVLDVDNSFDHDLTLDEIRALRYSGPLYFDFDAADLEEATQQFKKFLLNLKAKDVNLDMLRLYATGKKGYHIEVPPTIFMGKLPGNGMQNLPDIYREMAHSLYVDTLDLRVYTARRGRMWRCPNVKRDNGRYKVQLTADEAMDMTAELYDQVCSSPRNSLPIEPPVLNPELGLLFAQARDKVDRAVVKKKSKKQTADQLKKFGGQWPETFEGILAGATVKPGVGWNHLSMQLAIVASELGKTEEQLLTDAEGLINGHESDSTRYNTPSKRRTDLREMFRYVNGNPCYEFSVGAIMALLMPEVRANADIALGDFVPDDPEPAKPPKVNEDGTPAEPEEAAPTEPDEEDNSPVRIAKSGIFVRSDSGYNKASDIGIGRATALKKMDGKDIGYDVEVFKNSKPMGCHTLTMDKLTSRSALQSWTFEWSASVSTSDIQTAKIADILSRRAEKNNDVTYVVTREGVDLIVPHGAKSEDDFELIWSSPEKVVGNKGGQYRLRSHLDKNGTFKSDLLNAPDLTLEDAELIDNLLKMNTTQNLAKLLGWFSATFLTQIIRRYYRQFPSLQVFGQAGAGKSKTTGLLNHLHYFMKDPKQLMAQGQTMYPMIVAVASSASQPVIFEEVKAREMTKTLRDFLLNLFRNNYDGHAMARGALTKESASKDVTVNEFENSGPVAFVGESVENQSAILERCIVVCLSKQDRYGKGDHFHYVASRRTELGKLGKGLVQSVLALDLPGMRQDFDTIFNQVRVALGDKAEEMERPAFNMAVIALGLKLLGDTLHRTFGDRFDARIMEMQDSLIGNATANIPANMAEASRVLDIMAQLTRNDDMQYQLVKGIDYTLSEDGRSLDLKLRNAYTKYVRWQRSLGMEVLFDNEQAFITAMANYSGTLARACPDNDLLFDSPKAVVYRISTAYLDKEGVDAFRG